MADDLDKALRDCGFRDADTSNCILTEGHVPTPHYLTLPICGKPARSYSGDGLIVSMLAGGGLPPLGVIAIGSGGNLAIHMGVDAANLRSFAAAALATADTLDRRAGVQ
jgi:hypothetical protein